MKAARAAVGPDVKLMLDANCAYRWHEAVQIAERVAQYDPFWFEEPNRAGRLRGAQADRREDRHPDRHRRERVYALRIP